MSFAVHVIARTGVGPAWMVPAFCVVMQSVPERPTTLVVLGFVSFCLFYLSVFETANFRVTAVVPEMVSGPARVLQAVPSQVAQAGQEILASLGKSLVILLLTLYASICHGPVTSVSAQTQRYTSFEFLNNKLYVNPARAHACITATDLGDASYGVAVCASAGLTRAYTYLATAYLQDHALHGLLDGSDSAPEPWTAWLYLATLVYSAAWACTQFTEQVSSAHPARISSTTLGLTGVHRAGFDGASRGPDGHAGAGHGSAVHTGLLAPLAGAVGVLAQQRHVSAHPGRPGRGLGGAGHA